MIRLIEMIKPYKFIGQCDILRKKCDRNEVFWKNMMDKKQKITDSSFYSLVDMTPILDDGESPEEWIEYNRRTDNDFGLYISYWGNRRCIFIQTGGFEFIFVK